MNIPTETMACWHPDVAGPGERRAFYLILAMNVIVFGALLYATTPDECRASGDVAAECVD